MAKKQKKKLTVKEQQKRYRTLQFTCRGGEVVSILTPFITLGIVNYEKWFTTSEGWKVGLGGALALALMGLAVFLFTKKKESEKGAITNGWITMVVGWFAVAFIFVLLQSIMDQIATIMLFGGLGLLGAAGLDIEGNSLKKKANTLKEVLGTVEKDTLKEQAEKELKEEQEQEEYDGRSI